jgi:hypothetical protein
MQKWAGLALLLVLTAPSFARDVAVAEGESIPDIRPCVDGVARGTLHSTGEPVLIDDPDNLFGNSIYFYRFKPRSTIVGKQSRKSLKLSRGGHALRDVHVRDAIVFFGSNADGRTRFVDWAWVWHDNKGRAFIPVWYWPDAKYRNGDWRPANAANFAKPVTYRARQPYWDDVELTAEDVEAGLVERRGERYVLLNGIYLDDIPKMLEAAKQEACWR